MKKLLLGSLSLGFMFVFLMKCNFVYHPKIKEYNKRKSTTIVNDTIFTRIFDGIWVIETDYVVSDSMRKRENIIVKIQGASMRIFCCKDTTQFLKGVFKVTDGSVEYIYIPTAAVFDKYLYKYDYSFVKKYFHINMHNHNVFDERCYPLLDLQSADSFVLSNKTLIFFIGDNILCKFKQAEGNS